MARDEYEPNRVLGMSRPTDPQARQDREPQRVMGFPVDWFTGMDVDWVRSLAHPIRSYQRWLRRRRFGPYVIDEDEPRPKR